MTTYIELVDYFEAMPAQITGVRRVTVGSDEEELALQSNDIAYPHLRVDSPSLDFLAQRDNPKTRYTFQLAIMTNVDKQTDYRAENQALSDMEVLLRSIVQKMVADAADELFDLIDTGKKATPMRRYSGDNLFGWLMEVTLDLYTATC